MRDLGEPEMHSRDAHNAISHGLSPGDLATPTVAQRLAVPGLLRVALGSERPHLTLAVGLLANSAKDGVHLPKACSADMELTTTEELVQAASVELVEAASVGLVQVTILSSLSSYNIWRHA